MFHNKVAIKLNYFEAKYIKSARNHTIKNKYVGAIANKKWPETFSKFNRMLCSTNLDIYQDENQLKNLVIG